MTWLIQSILSIFIFLNLATAQTLTNVTIDNTDSRISYAGTWDPTASHTSALDIGGSHTLSEDPNGSATFSFTGMFVFLKAPQFDIDIGYSIQQQKGVAVYYLAPKWPYTVDSYVALDGGAPQLVDMTAPPQNSPNGEETVASDVLWSATGLTNGDHRVVVTRGPSGYAVADGFT